MTKTDQYLNACDDSLWQNGLQNFHCLCIILHGAIDKAVDPGGISLDAQMGCNASNKLGSFDWLAAQVTQL